MDSQAWKIAKELDVGGIGTPHGRLYRSAQQLRTRREYRDSLREALAEETVAAIRSRPYAEISPDKSIYSALQALAGLKVASLLVVENNRLVGVFTERDVLERVSLRFGHSNRSGGYSYHERGRH